LAIVISLLLVALLTGLLPFLDGLLNDIIPIALYAERYMDTLTGSNWFGEVSGIFFSFGISLIVLKFLYKGFNIYVGWVDGDADADPMELLTNFLRAMVVAVCFPTLYKWMASVIENLIEKLIDAIGLGTTTDFDSVISALTNADLFTGIITLVYFILFLILYMQFLVRGMEILILRIGIPFACVGLIDNDKGVFAPYIKKIFQSTLGVLVQVVLCKLGVGLMLTGQVFWAIACMNLAIKAPKFLGEFILAGGNGNGGFINKVYYTSNMARSVARMIKK
jgi:hypothetical protein